MTRTQLEPFLPAPVPPLRMVGSAEGFLYDLAVIGLGYVGLPTALTFHAAGLDVLGIDNNADRLTVIQAGAPDQVPVDRARLGDALVDDAFALTADVRRVGSAKVVLICVPTPLDEHQLPDVTMLRHACAEVVLHARPGQLVVLTSTSYVGTTDEMLVKPLAERGLLVGVDVFVGFSPERIDPGSTMISHEYVPRVFGGVTRACSARLRDFLSRSLVHVHEVSSAETAEMTKLFENTFRAVNIALANEMADISRSLGLDAMEVIEAAATKPYGFMPFFPGPGAGGHCIPCDPHYLLWQLRGGGVEAPLISAAMTCITRRPGQVVARLREALSDIGRGLAGRRVIVLGVAYKPNVEDVRESPALDIIEGLAAAGADVAYIDRMVPELRRTDGTRVPRISPVDVTHADVVLLHTRHAGDELSWLSGHPFVLDATFRATDLPNRILL